MEPIEALREQHISKMVENGDFIPLPKKPLGNGISYEILEQLVRMENVSVYESYIKSKEKEKYINKLYNMMECEIEYQSHYKWPYNVSPYFFPYESFQFMNYYSDKLYKVERIREVWDEYYDNLFDIDKYGIISENYDIKIFSITKQMSRFNPMKYKDEIERLFNDLYVAKDPEEIDSIKQTILSLGWNPEVDFNIDNIHEATNRIESIMNKFIQPSTIYDVTILSEECNDNNEIIEEAKNKKEKIFPISIILIDGRSTFSPIIKGVTNSEFSHAAICLGDDIKTFFSYNLNNNKNKNGGFSIEDITNYPSDGRFAVYTIFVSESNYNKIKERIEYLTTNIENTTYSVLNILLFPFNNINYNNNASMICSQFVDSLFKIINIDITKKNSSKVAPNDLYKSIVKNAKIYKIYDGILKDFNPKKSKRLIRKLLKNAKPVSVIESMCKNISNIMRLYIESTNPVLVEARKIPVEINKSGDILITNPFIDFNAEYSQSHKLLEEYYRVGNIEGMKYELARLYYMNYILERKLYSNIYLADKKKNRDTRARILNDFKKYLAIVLKKQPTFNFAEYYENSPFYAHTYEVSGNTVQKIKDLIINII